MRLAVPVLLLAACTDPVVDMQLVAPTTTTQLDTSCVGSVEVHVNGPHFPNDQSDQRTSCIPLDASAPTYAKLLDSIRGKFALSIPDGGLSSVEVYGWAGSCDKPMGDPTTPDLIFFANQTYVGQDLLEMKIVPNLDCKPSQVNVHLVDLMTLVSGTSPSDASCALAAVADGPSTGADTITLMNQLAGEGVDVYGGRTGAISHNSVASFTGLTSVGPESCLGWEGGSADGGALACVSPTPSVCAGRGEIEAPIVNYAVASASLQNDPNRTKFPVAILASVWTGTSSKQPAAGATIDIDPKQGVIEYVDPPTTGAKLVPRSTAGTGASGLFVVFTNTLATVNIHYNGKTTAATLSGIGQSPGGVILLVN